MHYSMLEPHCSNFRIIIAIFRVSDYLGMTFVDNDGLIFPQTGRIPHSAEPFSFGRRLSHLLTNSSVPITIGHLHGSQGCLIIQLF